jgi:hypothetical protein
MAWNMYTVLVACQTHPMLSSPLLTLCHFIFKASLSTEELAGVIVQLTSSRWLLPPVLPAPEQQPAPEQPKVHLL